MAINLFLTVYVTTFDGRTLKHRDLEQQLKPTGPEQIIEIRHIHKDVRFFPKHSRYLHSLLTVWIKAERNVGLKVAFRPSCAACGSARVRQEWLFLKKRVE